MSSMLFDRSTGTVPIAMRMGMPVNIVVSGVYCDRLDLVVMVCVYL